ncbi:MAG TPA: immunoglobulin-like domain-containing protein [Solirubrobacterales bacterium]|nr:immunoglobulin-like domain-containing protein [Solirubrobacterales bacterium]
MPAFCEPQQVRDFLAPLERMPKLHQPSANGQIGFGPESLRLRSASSLLVGEGEVGVTLSLAQRSRLRLPWTVTATLVEVNGNGRPIGKPRRLIRRVGWLKPFNGDSLRFEVSDDPAFYREMVALHGASGQKLGRFGFYYRAMPAIGRARLRLNASSYRPESTVFGRVENFGTLSAYYGVPYSIERLEGQGWVEAPESPDGPWILPLLVSGPGLSGKCNGFWIPPTMPPGRYRMVKRVGIGEWLPRKRGTARVLTAEFDVVP